MGTTRLAIAAALCLALGCKAPSPTAPRAVTAAAPAQTAAPTAAPANAERITFGPPTSSVGFTGAKVTGTHTGSFGAFTATLDLDAAHVENSRLEVTLEMASVTTDAERLTNHLKSPDLFDVARFPRATFTTTGLRAGGAGGATHTATGSLTLHGETRAITFPVTVAVTAQEVTARSEFVINRRDFGIVYPGRPDDLIRDEVTIRFDLRAPRRPAG